MEKDGQLKEFKKEFSDEISKTNVSVDDLKKQKVPLSVLEAEVALRKVFGDEIYVPKKAEDKIVGEKEIIKLSEEDIAFDSEVRELCDNLADNNFDAAVGVVLSKIELGEDWWEKI